jgi:valyl-tRNA synthetase
MTLEQALAFKRNLSQMRDKYEPKWVESHWYDYWCNKKYFHPEANQCVENPE